MFVNVLVSWAVLLACIWLAYLGVREVETTLARRPFSLLLTLLLVLLGAGLLDFAVDFISGDWLSEAFGYGGYYDNRVYSAIALGLVAGAGLLIRRDVALRLTGAACPQCATPLMGNITCPNCGWGRIPLPFGSARLRVRPSLPARQASNSAPTMMALGPNFNPAPNAGGVSTGYCMMCGSALVAGQTFCAKCGTPAGSAQS
jgi:hypothetical protein